MNVLTFISFYNTLGIATYILCISTKYWWISYISHISWQNNSTRIISSRIVSLSVFYVYRVIVDWQTDFIRWCNSREQSVIFKIALSRQVLSRETYIIHCNCSYFEFNNNTVIIILIIITLINNGFINILS